MGTRGLPAYARPLPRLPASSIATLAVLAALVTPFPASFCSDADVFQGQARR